MSETLPVPQPDPADDAINDALRRRKLAATAETLLKWSLTATKTMHELMVNLIRLGAEVGFVQFPTPNGRNCVLILGVGDNAVGPLTAAVEEIIRPQPQTEKPDPQDDPDFWKKA